MFTASRAEAAVRDLASSLDVKSYVVGFGSGFSGWVKRNYEAIAKAGGTFPTTPIFMDDTEKLRQLIETLALQMRASGLSFTGAPPMIAEVAAGDFIYQASFKIPAIGQWQGRLHKYSLNATTGKVGSVLWEAGAVLKTKHWRTGRNIWTAPYSGSGSGNNNFLAAGVGALKPMLFDGVAGSDAEAVKIIEFVRGRDAYDEDNDGDVTDERDWKLGDPYHSAPIFVGPPRALDAAKAKLENSEEKYKEDNGYVGHATAHSAREPVIYLGGNDGMLHAFKDSNGELHTPIPDSFLDGITRRTVIEIAKSKNIKINERKISPKELSNFEGCFLTGTAAEITPVSKITDHSYRVCKVILDLSASYDKLVRTKKAA